MERARYKLRWLEVVKALIAHKGAMYAAGFLAGFIVSLGYTDSRIVTKLRQLEREFGIKS